MIIKLTPQLLTEATSKISNFLSRSDKPIVISFSPEPEQAASFEAPQETGAIPSNETFLKISTLLIYVMIKHASGDPIILLSDPEIENFMKHFAVDPSQENPQEQTSPTVHSFEQVDDFVDEGEIKESQ